MALGLFDRYCSAASMIKHPQLYKPSQNSEFFNVKVFSFWVINALYHSIILFWLTYLAFTQDVAFADGKVGDYLFMGNMVYTYVILTVCIKAGIETTCWTWLSHLAIWGSIAMWLVFLALYPEIWPTINLAPEMVGMNKYVFSCAIFWMGLFLIPTTSLLRDLAWKAIRRTYFKTLREEVMEFELMNEDPSKLLRNATRKRLETVTPIEPDSNYDS